MGVMGNNLHKEVVEVYEKETLDCFIKIKWKHHSKKKKSYLKMLH